MDEHLHIHAKMLERVRKKPRYAYWMFLNADHIDDHRQHLGMPRIMEYLPGSVQWHERLEAECYFIAEKCV